MLAGGFDDLSEEGSYEFVNMKATSNAETELAMGRERRDVSSDYHNTLWRTYFSMLRRSNGL